jgi:hypothetical protein
VSRLNIASSCQSQIPSTHVHSQPAYASAHLTSFIFISSYCFQPASAKLLGGCSNYTRVCPHLSSCKLNGTINNDSLVDDLGHNVSHGVRVVFPALAVSTKILEIYLAGIDIFCEHHTCFKNYDSPSVLLLNDVLTCESLWDPCGTCAAPISHCK